MAAARLIAGVELGGTTCLAAIAELSHPTEMIETFETKTTTPQETLMRLSNFLKEKLSHLNTESFNAIGIASFGPIDLSKESTTYGHITTTPKKAWRNSADVVGFFKREYGAAVPIGFETDTNAPALAEMAKIASETNPARPPTVVYITVGTGVGLGAVVDGSPIHGLLHPEGGHMMIPVLPGDDYPGGCEFHQGPCVEGMVHSKAIAERAGVSPEELHLIPDDHEIWEKVGYYLGVMCLNVTYVLSPHVIVLGGGIMKRKILYNIVRKCFQEMLKGYLDVEKFKTMEGLATYIRESAFGNHAGIIGALELARMEAWRK